MTQTPLNFTAMPDRVRKFRVGIWAPTFDGVAEPTYNNFIEYHLDNPAIWKAFEAKALQAISAGQTQIGAKWLFEIIRWQERVEKKNQAWAVNNNWASYYARAFTRKYPQFADRFEFRATSGVREAA